LVFVEYIYAGFVFHPPVITFAVGRPLHQIKLRKPKVQIKASDALSSRAINIPQSFLVDLLTLPWRRRDWATIALLIHSVDNESRNQASNHYDIACK
jgi:hypothetical protein